VQYISAHRARLSKAVQQLCREELWLNCGDWLCCTSYGVLLPPDAADTLQILQELSSSGSSVRVLDACYAPIWSNAESKLVLTEFLGLSQADAVTAINSIVEVHSKCKAEGSPVSRQQLLMHLQHLARHMHLLEGDANLCQQVQQAVVLRDSKGNPTAATELFFPLPADFPQGLQKDMRAAGMRTLHSCFAAEGASAAPAASAKHNGSSGGSGSGGGSGGGKQHLGVTTQRDRAAAPAGCQDGRNANHCPAYPQAVQRQQGPGWSVRAAAHDPPDFLCRKCQASGG
jgi:hypothetical protein